MNRFFLLFLGLTMASTALTAMPEVRQARRQKPPATTGAPKKDCRRTHINSRKLAEDEAKKNYKATTQTFVNPNSKKTLADKALVTRSVFDWNKLNAEPWHANLVLTETWWQEFDKRLLSDLSYTQYSSLKENFDDAKLNFEKVCFPHTQRTLPPSLDLDPRLVAEIKKALGNKFDASTLADCFALQAVLFELADIETRSTP